MSRCSETSTWHQVCPEASTGEARSSKLTGATFKQGRESEDAHPCGVLPEASRGLPARMAQDTSWGGVPAQAQLQ